ncbi:hypothetical protein COCC4DRAFT_133810 [Bipolaris maydis ATCC 48331]|uniref:Cytochrome P450 monooxygenase n=2 Tax=Cochliobolus heterostrophus TaxID=5016 RepID=M2U0C6_COCH5|nr:uncharacterized protein COCC4DRAFT_133810 [Bipolaris maydis ATCC 48331]EMD87526.1 hypothetical protein COCHEDRAFT_1113621 [Bipolaris maydis C5]ENI06726.1 hypothetical protein COCC4DRAFT_133810 [Bipolaris maydis ATCC 48331]KAJ6267011.1 cytochrome P450 [Bipolaris maydis]
MTSPVALCILSLSCAIILCVRDITNLIKCFSYLLSLSGLWYFWRGFLWPLYFSPLRHLQSVPESGWFSAETLRLYTEPRGVAQCEWYLKDVPEGLVRYRSLLGFERLLVVSPEALADVLVTRSYEFRKPPFVVTLLRQILGRGILLAEGDEHRMQRKELLPAFSFRHVKELYPVMWRVGESLTSVMAKTLQYETPTRLDMLDFPLDLASRATLDIIGVAGMGQDFGAIRNPSNNLHQAYSLLVQSSKQATFIGILRLVFPDWLVNHLPLERNTQVNHAIQVVRSSCQQMIREIRPREKDPRSKADVDIHNKNILTVAAASGTFTDELLVDQLMTFLAAGHETTATALTWAIYIICACPDIQDKLRDEVWSRLPRYSPTSESIPKDLSTIIDSKMPYLNAVCLEVFRYFSPVPVTFREAIKDTCIFHTPVPAGTLVVLAPRVTNRHSTLWGPDALIFNPDHFKSDGLQNGTDKKRTGHRNNFAMMTFLHGPRSCIGQSFAKAELAILLASLVEKFEFKLAKETPINEKEIKVSRGATARPENGLMVQIRKAEPK